MQPVRKQEGDKGAAEESHFKEALVELSKTRAFPVAGSHEILKFAADFRAISLSQTTTSAVQCTLRCIGVIWAQSWSTSIRDTIQNGVQSLQTIH